MVSRIARHFSNQPLHHSIPTCGLQYETLSAHVQPPKNHTHDMLLTKLSLLSRIFYIYNYIIKATSSPTTHDPNRNSHPYLNLFSRIVSKFSPFYTTDIYSTVNQQQIHSVKILPLCWKQAIENPTIHHYISCPFVDNFGALFHAFSSPSNPNHATTTRKQILTGTTIKDVQAHPMQKKFLAPPGRSSLSNNKILWILKVRATCVTFLW